MAILNYDDKITKKCKFYVVSQKYTQFNIIYCKTMTTNGAPPGHLKQFSPDTTFIINSHQCIIAGRGEIQKSEVNHSFWQANIVQNMRKGS